MSRVNVLLITTDDMNYDSPGCMGCPIPDITPRIDRLASEGVLFEHSHVAIGVCQPSRSVLMTGRYPHRNGAAGFEDIDSCVTTLPERLREYGYFNGIIGKVEHITPVEKFAWDYAIHTLNPQEHWGRDPEVMYRHTKEFIELAHRENRPFFLMANSHDPHRPFAGSEYEIPEFLSKSGKTKEKLVSEGSYFRGKYVSSSKYYKPEEITTPCFLPDIPEIRREMSHYYSSVHRADEAVGRILDALEDCGEAGSTLVMYLSDNGISMPFAKTNCYMTSTRSPFILRLPGVIPKGIRRDTLCNSIDFVPTVLDYLGLPQIDGVDGRSLRPVISGERRQQAGSIFTFFNRTAKNSMTGKAQSYPMRCVQNKKYAYIYNEWADGSREFRSEAMMGITFNAMKAAAESDIEIRQRVDFYLHRVPEEVYDLESDPGCLKNLISDPAYKADIETFRSLMYSYMGQSHDPLIGKFSHDIMENQ